MAFPASPWALVSGIMSRHNKIDFRYKINFWSEKMTEPKSNTPQITGGKNNYYKYLVEQEPSKNLFGQLVIKEPGKYPARMGLVWKDEEIVKLLTNVRKKKTIPEIAIEHERTEGSIIAYLKKLAGDYYFNDNRPIEEIKKFTRLSEEVILEVIKKREGQKKMKEAINTSIAKQTEKAEEIKKNENTEIIAMLKNIQQKLDLLLNKTQ